MTPVGRIRDPRSQQVPTAVARGSLADGLMVCLGLLAADPSRFEPAAVAWHGRWCGEMAGMGFAEARAVLSALEALSGSDPVAAGGALRAACGRARRDELAATVDAWLERRRPRVVALPAHAPPPGPSAA
jgi:hypothetical protein